ncbi:hypothetical protein ACIQZN_13210 [Streptomyces sp. NPDC097595]|uniref:hypothetical protein n=1 Tax=Streptomyces sp. NPDC097595 TaxID=3366090 RepID=UPI00382CF11D
MLEAGEPVVMLARWLGRSPPAITLRYYAHSCRKLAVRGAVPSTVCSGSGDNGWSVGGP